MAVGMSSRITTPPLILAVETSSRTGSVALALGAKMVAESWFSAPLRHSAEIFPAIRDLLDRLGRKPSQIKHVYISCGPGSFSGLRIATTLAKMMNLANAARIVAVDTLDVVAANVADLWHGLPARENTAKMAVPRWGWPRSEEPSPKPSALRLPPAADCRRLAAVLDAKRGNFFIAVYERQAKSQDARLRTQDPGHKTQDLGDQSDVWKKVLADSLMTIPEFLTQFANGQCPIWLLGDGLVYYRDGFQAEGIRFFEQTYWSAQARNVHALGWHKALRGEFAEPLTLTPNYLRKPDITMKPR